MATIKQIFAREIINSKATPTVEAAVETNDGVIAVASSPTGTSVGAYEALELRDDDVNHYQGRGVLKAVEHVQKIIGPKLSGMDVANQQKIDRTIIDLDGTKNKSNLGSNATLPVSIAVAKAAAITQGLPLYKYLRQYTNLKTNPKIPTPLFNIINGGLHGSSSLDFQEFIVTPASSKSFKDALELGVLLYMCLKENLKNNNYPTLVGDEGGFGPDLSSNKDALNQLVEAAEKANVSIGYDIFLGLDAASGTFYKNHEYVLKDKGMALSSRDLNNYYIDLVKQFHLLYLEDPLAEDDWDGWKDLNFRLSQQTIITGDDLVATNPYRLQMAIDKKAISGVIIKPNQIGTVMETMAVERVAQTAGIKVIVSHRSGETNDDFVADLAVAVSADYVKFGAPARGERVAKYNRLLEIDRELQQSK